MRASSDLIQAIIRRIARSAAAADPVIELYEAIETAADSQVDQITSGTILIGTGNGGVTTQFALPPVGELTASDITEALNRIQNAADVLIAADEDITDAALKTGLLAAFQPRYSVASDFSRLRV